MEGMLNCVLWGLICAKDTAGYLVGKFPCLGLKGKSGSVCK